MLNVSDILRVFTDSIILAQLNISDSYGYAINKVISEQSDSFFELKEATLYTSFRRLEESNFITSYWGDENSGARRRYYSITEKGKEYLEENKDDWKKIKSILEKVLNTNQEEH
jgi:DNA-binding PadR family transcriptional regulator